MAPTGFSTKGRTVLWTASSERKEQTSAKGLCFLQNRQAHSLVQIRPEKNICIIVQPTRVGEKKDKKRSWDKMQG